MDKDVWWSGHSLMGMAKKMMPANAQPILEEQE